MSHQQLFSYGDPRLRMISRTEYYHLYENGFFEEQRLELIRGQIMQRASLTPAHCSCISLATYAIEAVFGRQYWVRNQSPIVFDEYNEAEPDLAVVPRSYLCEGKPHPSAALVIVEIADSTLDFALGEKRELYAENNILDYWIVDLVHDRLLVHRLPMANGYAEIKEYGRGEAVSLLAMPEPRVSVDDLLL